MAAEHLHHLSFGRIRIALKEISERHENAGGAESALQRVVVLERLLQRVERTVGSGERFHCRHRPALGLNGKRQTRAHRGAIDEDGAATAYAVLAPDVGSGGAEPLAQKVAEQHARLGLARQLAAVERQAEPRPLVLAHAAHRLASSITTGASRRKRSRRMRAEACTSS